MEDAPTVNNVTKRLEIKFIFDETFVSFAQAYLFFPSMGIAQIGQNVSWSIISRASNPKRIAIFMDDSIEASITIKSLNNQQLPISAMELWQISPNQFIIHFNSPTFPHLRQGFVVRLFDWILKSKFQHVIIFGGANSRSPLSHPGKIHAIINDSPFSALLKSKFDIPLMLPFEKLSEELKLSVPKEPIFLKGLPIVNSGIMRIFHYHYENSIANILSSSATPSVTTKLPTFTGLIIFCFEGNTTPIISSLEKVVDAMLSQNKTLLKQ